MNVEVVQAIEVLGDECTLSVVEMLACTQVDRTRLAEMVEIGLLDPSGGGAERWQFAARDLRRLRAAERLIADLGVNLSGAAIILDLIDERAGLLTQVETLRRLLAE